MCVNAYYCLGTCAILCTMNSVVDGWRFSDVPSMPRSLLNIAPIVSRGQTALVFFLSLSLGTEKKSFWPCETSLVLKVSEIYLLVY